jgi:hypothetical protein
VNFGYWVGKGVSYCELWLATWPRKKGRGAKRKEKGPMNDKYQHFLVRQQQKVGLCGKI